MTIPTCSSSSSLDADKHLTPSSNHVFCFSVHFLPFRRLFNACANCWRRSLMAIPDLGRSEYRIFRSSTSDPAAGYLVNPPSSDDRHGIQSQDIP